MLAEKFKDRQIRYGLIGGLGLHAAGYSRATGDIDLLVHEHDISNLKDVLQSLGFAAIHEDANVLHFSASRFLIGGVDVIVARRMYTLRMLSGVLIGPQGIPVVSPEGIIGLKVQAIANDPARYTRDMADIEWLLRAYQGTLDMTVVGEYFALFDMQDELLALLERIRNVE